MKKKLTIQSIVLAISILLFGIKTIAFIITNSNAILTDAAESVINVLAGILAIYGLWLSAKPKDKDHPYGHGKIEFIASGLEGGMISIAGIIMIGKSIYALFYPNEINRLDDGIYLSVISGALNAFMAVVLIRMGKKEKSLIMETSGRHLLSDAYSTLALIIGLILIYLTNQFWLDNLVAISFGILIIYTGISVLRKSIAGVMDEQDFELVDKVGEILNSNRKPEWIDIHNLRIIKFGVIVHIDCHVTLPWFYSLQESHNLIDEIEDIIQKEMSVPIEIFIHTDPCVEFSCGLCKMDKCVHRKKDFVKSIAWDRKLLTLNEKHNL